MAELQARWHRAMTEIPRKAWQELTGPAGLPFYGWPWLHALERSGSIVPRQGWQPCHLSLWRQERLIAALEAEVAAMRVELAALREALGG